MDGQQFQIKMKDTYLTSPQMKCNEQEEDYLTDTTVFMTNNPDKDT